MSTDNPIRVGAVNYLNTKPLVYQLEEIAPNVRLSFDLPSRLADQLAANELDVALIPSVEYFRNADAYRIISDACIGCRGPVWSVKLFCRVPADQIKTVALDEGSRTSAALVRILLKQKYGIEPQLLPLPIGDDMNQSTADAMLLIGDRAMHTPLSSFAEIWDLGDIWCRWTELPFVFAMWVTRADFDCAGLAQSLNSARDLGQNALQSISEIEAAKVALSVPECLSYLRDNLHFHLGPRELAGLRLFYDYAAELDLAPKGLDWSEYDCETA
ncbi:MAG: hypothetical protein COA78_25870 [Blastopirellula sp.]|nr:MAG: hypothetical protein COA78_25870 [Blastopirellula sp.]